MLMHSFISLVHDYKLSYLNYHNCHIHAQTMPTVYYIHLHSRVNILVILWLSSVIGSQQYLSVNINVTIMNSLLGMCTGRGSLRFHMELTEEQSV